jgi:negative regulator of sigma-B (phosphoserine phosphatase)
MEATGGRLPFLEWGTAGRPISGETESGDQYVVHSWPGGALLAVIDGLGHGPAAALAANEAVAILQAHAQEPLVPLVGRCHEALRRTNGAVMTLAAFRASDNSLTWLGVGNVEGLLLRADVLARRPRDDVLQRGGVVGYQLPRLQTSALVVGEGDILIFASDGVRGRFADRLDLDRSPREVALDILDSHARPNDDALVLVARFSALAP